MRAGIARRNITPPVGVDLTGYIGRPGPSTRVHDNITATALILDDGDVRFGIISLDILGLDLEQDKALRQAISEATGIDQTNLLIACSHTHAGPAIQLLRGCGTPDENYLRWASSQVVETVKEANADLADATLSFTRTESDLAWNRRNWVIGAGVQQSKTSGVITDPEVGAMIVSIQGKEPVVAFNYACHGVVMGNDNVETSADWIGAARAAIEASPSVGSAFFLQGCCGNINPRLRGTFEEVKNAGDLVAVPLLNAIASAVPINDPRIKVAWRSVELPYQDLPPEEELEQEITFHREEIRRMNAEGTAKISVQVAQAMQWWAEDSLKTMNDGGGPVSVTIPLQVVKIGDLLIAAIPGEVFCEFSLAIRKMNKANVMVVGYANGNIGYVPTAEAFAEGGYETHNAYKYYGIKMIGPESEGIILGAMKELVAEVG